MYTALDVATVDRELARSARRAGLSPRQLGPRRLATIEVRLGRVLDLTSPAVREALGVTLETLTDDGTAMTRSIGAAAHRLGYEGILAPSATGEGTVLAVFPDRLAAGSAVSVAGIADGHLGAWAARQPGGRSSGRTP